MVTMVILGVLAAALIAGCGGDEPAAVPAPTEPPAPAVAPTQEPLPTPDPTPEPTPEPTAPPEPGPTATPAPAPTATPMPEPPATLAPTATPAPAPTAIPTPAPTTGAGTNVLQPSNQPPHIFIGTAQLNGAPAPAGTAILAMVGTFQVGSGSVTSADGTFGAVLVPYPDQMVTFMVGTAPASQSAVRTMVGGSTVLTLTASR